MPVKTTPRYLFFLFALIAICCVIFVLSFAGQPQSRHAGQAAAPLQAQSQFVTSDHAKGPSIMPKLGNETAKAELGRATWKYFHTVMARFPDTPTANEKGALFDYIHLFQRLYPCGECADHFGDIITKYPPQVSSRSAAAAWACHVHNEVNKSLKKELFDCTNIGDFYDCGCAEDEKDKTNLQVAKVAITDKIG